MCNMIITRQISFYLKDIIYSNAVPHKFVIIYPLDNQTCIVVIPISSLLSRRKRTANFLASSLSRIPPNFNGSGSSWVVSKGNRALSTSDDSRAGLLKRTKDGKPSVPTKLEFITDFAPPKTTIRTKIVCKLLSCVIALTPLRDAYSNDNIRPYENQRYKNAPISLKQRLSSSEPS